MNYLDGSALVAIHCMAFNHEPYIRECLEGFVMQKTNFRFVAIVHDDASTDRTADIIREYEAKYPEIIKPIYETENQWSKPDGSLDRIMNTAIDATGAKYIAICEGDDYWTDPLKLQKQVDFLEENEEYSLCCSDVVVKSMNGDLNWSRYSGSCKVPIEDIIIGGGLWLQTVSYVYRNNPVVLKDYPDCCKNCHVGDYPLIIWLALHGGIYYIAEKTAVYRFQCKGSWTSRQDYIPVENQMPGWRSEVDMLLGLDQWSQGKYHGAFTKRIIEYLYDYIILSNKGAVKMIMKSFRDVKHLLSRKQRMHVFFLSIHQEKMFYRIMSLKRKIKIYA